MDMNQFIQNNNENDGATQKSTNNVAGNTNASNAGFRTADMSTQKAVDPVKDLGFKSNDQVAEENFQPDDITRALGPELDMAAQRKKEEMNSFIDALEQCGGVMTEEDYSMSTGTETDFASMLDNPPDPLNKELKSYTAERIEQIKATATQEELEAMGLADPTPGRVTEIAPVKAEVKKEEKIIEMPTYNTEEDADIMDDMNIGAGSIDTIPTNIAKTIKDATAVEKRVEDMIPTVEAVNAVEITEPITQVDTDAAVDTKQQPETSVENTVQKVNSILHEDLIFDVDIDKELADLDDDIDTREEADKSYKDKLKNASRDVRAKVMPITDRFDISGFQISNLPVSIDNSVKMATSVKTQRTARWALFASGRPIEMRHYMGTDIDELSRVTPIDQNDENLTISDLMKRYKIFYDHTISPKPATVEEWIKTISVMDEPHLFATALKASFDGVLFMPIDCVNPQCNNGFITDSLDFEKDMVNYKDSEAKTEAMKIYNSNPPESEYHLYTSNLIPISQVYAISFKDPSIWDTKIAPKYIESDWLERMNNVFLINMYVDKIFVIDQASKSLRPLNVKEYKDNPRKTIKAKVLALAKVLSTLTSDQYNLISAYINDITKPMDYVRYQLPETQCPKCKSTVPAIPSMPSRLLFTRHRVTSLANG